VEFEAFRKDRTKVFTQINSKLVIEEGTVKGFVNIISYITERKQMEKELREREEKYRLLIDNIDSSITVFDGNGVFL
jgi:PAS domain-containing protein